MVRLPLIMLLVFAGGELGAQEKKRGRCSGDLPDAAWTATEPVYRDCEVDRMAELRSEPRLAWAPPASGLSPGRCYTAELEFVVDTAGWVELPTVRSRAANDPGLEEAMRAGLPMMRYQPARHDEGPVRQLVVYKRGGGVVVRVTTSSGRPTAPMYPSRPPRC